MFLDIMSVRRCVGKYTSVYKKVYKCMHTHLECISTCLLLEIVKFQGGLLVPCFLSYTLVWFRGQGFIYPQNSIGPLTEKE